MKRIFTSLVMVLGFVMQSQAQLQNMNSACEQNPCQALPVCATTVTNPYSYQSNTGNPGVAATGCGNSIGGTVAYSQNWMYYRFTCQTSGTLNFTITPNDPSSDLDWAMWNTTVSGCSGIATGNLVECNSFAGLGGTGMAAVAAQAFEPQITLVAGNTYILGISRRSGGTNTTPPSGPPYATGSAGFSIAFAGTANIVNNSAPALLSVIPYDPCAPLTQLKLKLSQQVRCFQIQGTDFSFTGGGTVPSFTASGGTSCPGCTGTTGFNWSNVSDTVTINFSSALPAGNYTISLVGVNPFSSLCGVPANTAITLPLSVSANLNDSIRTGFSCATLTYVDTIYGVNGVSPYQFKSQGPGQSNTYGAATSSYNIFSGLTGGNTYTFTVKDATGCTGDSVLQHPPYIPLGLTTFKKDPPCTNQFTKDTFRVVNTTGGAAPFTYVLTSTPASASATAVQYAPGAWNNLQQGSFTITCTDKWGCTATATANIANPPVVTFPTPTSSNPACFGDSTGTITVNASGGSGVMSYTLVPTPPTVIYPAPGYFTQVIGGLPGAVSPGITYTITVSDVNGCTATNTRTLTTPASINVSTAAATKVNPTCTNPCGGSYTPVASGGTGSKKLYRLPLVTPPNTYTDSVTTTGGSFLNLCQGTYTIRCVDVLGCNTTVTVTLTLPPIPDIVNDNIVNATCFGSCNGQILNTTTGGTTPYAYTITPNNNPPCGNAVSFGTGGDFQNLPAGTYKVVVTSPNQCKDSVENLVITQPLAITWNSVVPTNVLCFGNNTGSIAVNATGGTGTISYTITPLGPQLNTTGNFSNLTAQQYTITATDASGCTKTSTVQITQPANLLYSSATFVAPSCNGSSDGSITVVTTGGNPTITYSINPNPASNTTGIFTGLPAATYTVLATDANGCTKSTTLIMTQPAPIVITSATFVSPLCFGDANGTISVVTTGGVSPKTYTISPLGPQSNTTGNFTGLTAQVYTVTITDANSCSTTTSISVVQPTALNFLSAGFTQPSCGGNSNGTISASASGGTGTKTYTISPLGPQSNTTGNFTGLTAQTYTITVTDANACTATSSVTVTQPTPLIITSALFTQPLCFNGNNGTMSVTTTGGTGGKTYTITPLGPQSNTTGNFSNLTAQSYTVTATDINGCSSTSVVLVTQPTQVTFNSASFVQPLCFGAANGTATANATGGTGIITYTISPLGPQSNTTGNFSNLSAQSYTITGTDANGCTRTTTITITQPTALTFTSATFVAPLCNGNNNGTIAATATGGTGTKTYTISPLGPQSNTTGNFTGLTAQAYTVTCTDNNGCTTTTAVTVTQPAVLNITGAAVVQPLCNGNSNGTMAVTATGGTGTKTYTISPLGPQSNTTGNFTGLSAQTYTVTVTDVNGCTSTSAVVVAQPAVLAFTSATFVAPLCFGNSNGTIASAATGGTGTKTYTISPLGPQSNTTGNFTGLSAQTYTITVTDANACTATTTVIVTQPPVLAINSTSFTQPLCNGNNNGTITAVASGGFGTITYTINPLGPQSNTTGNFSNLTAQTYTVTVSDANACTKTSTVVVTQPAALTFTSATFVAPLCNGNNNGTIAATATGGTGTKTYTISPLGPQSNTTGNFSGLTAQAYTVTCTDDNGCTTTTAVTVTQPAVLNITGAAVVQPLCFGNSNGTMAVTATGGTGTKTYTISPLGPQSNTTGNFTGLSAQTYTVTVTDVNGCTSTSAVVVNEPLLLDINAANFVSPLCFGNNNGSITSSATGGTGTKTFTISPLGPQSNTTGNFSNLSAQTYTITVTDANNCTATSSVIVTQPTQLVVNSSSFTQPLCYGSSNGTATVVASGGTNTLTYTISPLGPQSNTTGNFSNLSAQCYTVTVTDANACTKTTSFCVTQPTAVAVNVTGTTSPTCTPGCDGSITVSANGGTGIISLASNPSLTQSPANTFTGACAATAYVITATDANGCTANTSTSLSTPNAPTPVAVALTNVSCNGQCNGTAQVTIVAGITYTILPNNPGQNFNTTTGAVTGLCAGTYTVSATNALSCVGTTTFTISQPAALTLAINTSVNPNCVPGCNGTATVTAAGGNGTNVFTIAPSGTINATTGNASALCAGTTYTITVTDVKGCTSTTTITPTTPASPSFTSATFTQPLCNGNSNGTITVTTTGGTGVITYTITPSGPQSNTTGIFSNLTAQSYTVTATDVNGCTTATTVIVTQPNVLAVTSATFTQPLCNGLSNGTVTIVATGGTGTKTYTINPLGPQSNTTGVFNNLTAQCYTVTVTDANNCTTTTSVCVTQPTAVAINVTGTTSPTCTPGCDGTITVSANGGTGIISLASNPSLTQLPANTFTGACAATNYVITATDANGCTANTSTTLTTPNAPTPVAVAVTNVSCNGQCNGTAQVTIVAGITYTIAPNNPGQNFNTTTGAVTGLCAGTYTVSATNALSCVGTTTFTISQPTALTLAINTSVNPNCVPGCNGTATVTAAGGNGTNVFTIAPSGTINATTGNASALCAGTTYTITVTDVKGCTSTTTITPVQPASPSFTLATFTQPLCNGNNNGSITVTTTGGTGVITYTITPSGPQSNTTGIFSNLTAQSYTVTATDVNGCTTTTAVIVTQPNVLAINSATFTQPLCNGLSNGTVTIVATGGTGTKTYTIAPNGPQSNTTGIFSNLTAQCYTVTVTDANNCTTTTSVCVTQPTAVAINVTGTTSPTCTPGCDGTITVSANGGTGTITLLSAPFLTQLPASTFINACAATNYVITATDANGCTANTSTTLTTPNAPTPVAVAVTNVSCNGQCNGTAQVTIVAGITYTIAPINPGQNFNTTTGAVSGLCAGTYTVTATNALSCVGTTTFVITQPAVLTLAINTSTNPTCVPSNNGTATVTSTGGNGTNVYTIAPSGTINATTGNASNLAPGVAYTITVTDVKGCTSTTTITPATPVLPVINSASVTQPLCNGNNNGGITVTATGNGTITYTITPLGPQSNTTGIFSNLTAQQYTVTATTANGCTGTSVVVVTQPNIITFNTATFTQPSCNAGTNGTISVVATGGTGSKTYTITPNGPQSNTTGVFNNLSAQCYTITVTDANNCTKTTSVCVTQPTAVAINVTGTTSPTCTPGCDGTITVSANGGTGTITLLSAPFLTQLPANTFINVCAATNYVITATDANGCTANTSTTLTTPNAPTPAAVTVTNATCNGQCNGTAQVTIIAGITYTIAPNNPGQNFNTTTGAVTGLCAGTYTVSATNALSCVGTTTFVITQPTAVTLNVTGAVNPTSPLVCNGSAQANGSGGTGAITYTISAPGVINTNTGAISALCDGCYTVTATDANGCTATTSFCVAAAVATLTPNITNIANATCFNTCNGTAQAGAVGGVQPYAYSISPTVPSGAINATTGAITGLCAGTVYTITVTDAVSTSATITVTVTQPTQVNISVVSTTQASCAPGCDAVAIVSANGGTPGYTYSIAPSAGITQNPAGTFTGLCSGTAYVATATDANGCTRTISINITTQSSPTPVANVVSNVTCFGLCNGTAQVTTVPGVTYTVAGSGTPAINAAGAVSGLCAGTYIITATNAGQCTGTTSITITQPTQLTLALTTSSNPTCNPGCDGTASFTATGGVGTNVYSIAPATGTINASNGNASTLCAGTTYTVTVTNANGCTATATVLLTTPASPSVNITSTTSPTCLPGCDGGATSSAVAGGVYSILPATGTINTSTGIASNLCAGTTYTITVANASNCTAQTTVTLTTPGSPTVTIANTTTPSCVPGCDGTATPNPQAGLTYTILPSGTINATTGVASNLCAGTTYTIKATDANGCTGQTTVNLTAPVPTPISIVSSTQPNCVPGCNGTATPTSVAGAVYTIAPSGTINSGSGVASNLCAGITYTITATTANGCSATTSVIMNTPANPTASITAQTNPTGPANCNGTAQAAGAGGLAPYTYSIAGAGTPVINVNTGAASNLCGSCYTITVTDANGCTATTTTCLINPLSVSAVGNNVSCFGSCNGTGQATAVGGSQAGYTYAITGGATINTNTGAISNLCAGTIYTITATDLNNATATTTLQISGPTQLAFNAATTTSPSCNPGCDGTISISANNGTPGYTYTLASPAGMNCTPNQATPGNFSNLGAGTYTVTVTDANGCTKTSTVVVTPSGVPVINSVTGTNPLCNNQCNGTVVTNATGATSYTLLPGNTTNATGTFNGLCAGSYTVTATNAAGCTVTSTVTLANPSVLTVNTTASTNVACNGQSTGTITFNVTGGTGVITYTSVPALVGNGNYTNVAAGTYTITAADVNNCSVSHVFTITQPAALTINSATVASPLCSNQSNGVITLNISGGTGLYSATTNPPSSSVGPAASPLVINGLSPLTYTVTVSDANNCSVTSAVTVPGSVPIVINSVNVTAPLCNTSCNGIITTAATGGNGTLTYTINPAGPASNTTGVFNSICGGNYTVTVTDVNTCTQTTAVTVTPPPVLTFTSVASTNPLCFGNNNGTITVTSAGGTGLKVYSITPASNQPTPGNFTGLTAQAYTVVVTDANNCSTSTVVTLTNPAQLVWNNPTSTNVTCFGGNNGSITSPATGGTGTKTYTINPAVQASNTTGSFTNLSAQCYTITVSDIQGCSLTRVVCITQPPAITFNQPTVVNVLCFGAATGSISITANGGTPTYTYALTPANGTQTSPGVFDNLLAGTYAVTVTDANGCTASTTNILISQPPAITFTSVNVQNVACFGDATGSIAVTAQGGVGAIQFSLQPSGSQPSPGFFNNLYAGTYTVSAVDGNNCVVTTLVTVGSNPQLKLNSITLTEPICFGDNNGAIAATAIGGVAPIQYSLNNSPFQNNGTFNNLYAGYYIMTLRDAIGCMEDTLINLTQPTEVGAKIETTAALCVDSEDGKVKITGTGGRGGYKYYITPGLYINKSGVFSGLAIGTYTLRVVDTAGCEYRNVFSINPPANPLNSYMTKQDLTCYGRGNEGQATANVGGGTPPYNFLWNTSPVQTTATASTLYFGLYKVQITDANGCSIKDSVYISEGPCCDVAFIPNAFSPNGDGNNDEFRILTSAGVELQQLEIFNRWGQSVWKSNDVHRSWNGYISGQEAPMDTYYYVLRYKCTRDNDTYTKKGDVILVR